MGRYTRPEILAPAGSMESLRAAVAAGCDAVYIGGSKFGARAYADNPQGDDMRAAIRYCHRYGVKIYMTVNTLFKDRELEQELFDFLLPCYQAGLDAVIVQDVGVVRFLHRNFPDLAIHASTQMTLTMGKSTALLEPYGVTRLVPARELTLSELRQMRRDTSLEMEVFVHGALCYCYSGQCLFSSMQGGRSGNRGRCAQPCRQRYKLEGSSSSAYLLSPKENCNLNHIGDLIEAGVDSFKIEGRMKRPEYVALTTALYRKYVDLYLRLGREKYAAYQREHNREWEEDLRRLAELYNREGFTSGYLEGKAGVPRSARSGRGEMLAAGRPNHGGVQVGKVTAVDRQTVTYRLERELHPQDVVEFRNRTQAPGYEYTLGEPRCAGETVTARYQKGCKIRPGDKVYRTKDAELLRELRERYLSRDPEIPVDMQFLAVEGHPVELTVSAERQDGSRETLTLTGDVCQRAKKRAATEEELCKLLGQTGDTVFRARSCQTELRGELFLPVGAVKRLRRQALDKLQQRLERPEEPREELLSAHRKPDCGEMTVRQGSGERLEKADSEKSVLGQGSGEKADGEKSVLGQDSGEKADSEKAVLGQDSGEKADSEKSVFGQDSGAEAAVCVASVLYAWQAELAVSSGYIHEIYLRTETMTEEELRGLIRKGRQQGKKMYLMLPAVFRDAVYRAEKAALRRRDCLYHMPELEGFVIRNLESYVFLTGEAGIAPNRIITDAGLYTANREAEAFWREQGVRGNTLPLELTGKEQEGLAALPGLEAIVYGHVPLMISAQCVRYNTQGCGREKFGQAGKAEQAKPWLLRDGRERSFYVFNACKYCYNIIYHGEPLSLGEEEPSLRRQGVRRFRYDLTVETPRQAERILTGKLPKGQKGHFYHPVD